MKTFCISIKCHVYYREPKGFRLKVVHFTDEHDMQSFVYHLYNDTDYVVERVEIDKKVVHFYQKEDFCLRENNDDELPW